MGEMWVNDFIFQKYVKSSRGHVGGKESRDKTSSRFILKGDVFVVIYYDVGRYGMYIFRHLDMVYCEKYSALKFGKKCNLWWKFTRLIWMDIPAKKFF